MKVLIIKSDKDSFEQKVNSWFKQSGCYVECVNIQGKKGIRKRLIYLKEIINLKIKYRNSLDKVVVFDDVCLFFYVLFFFSNSYLWLWNTVPNSKTAKLRLALCNRKNSIYSFDEQDCLNYKFKHNTQFFFCEAPNEKTHNKHDLYFVGADKGRYQMLDRIYKHLILNSIEPLFQMIPANEKKYQNKKILCEHFVEYEEVLKNLNSSKAVLDLCKPGQVGMTFRAMEALFYDKKIVTNNTHYRDLPFYSPESIYFLVDGLEGLKDFIEAPEVKYDDSIKDYYSIENWLRRFE